MDGAPATRNDAWADLVRKDDERYLAERMKQAVVSYPPRWATLAISSRCTNRCVFCSYHSLDARGGRSNVYGLEYSMSLERFKALVDFFHAGRVPHVHICSTGETLLHPDVMAMIDYAVEVQGDASFQSNFNRKVLERGGLMPQILERRHKISYIATDIHAGDASSFESIKRGSSFADLLATLKTLSKSGIPLMGFCILSKSNHASLPALVELLAANEISLRLDIGNLYPHMFNDFTSLDNVYMRADQAVTDSLHKARELGQRLGVEVLTPIPHDDPSHVCDVFWTKVQVWPVAGVDPGRYDENLITHACNAVVLGDIKSLGYASDYATVMDFWNNERLVAYREKILAGQYPDRFCWSCCHGVGLKPPA